MAAARQHSFCCTFMTNKFKLVQARLTHKLVGLSEEPISLPKIFTSLIEIGESKSLSLVHFCEPVCLM